MITWVIVPSLYSSGLGSIYTDSRHYCSFDNIVTWVIVTECCMTTNNLVAVAKIMLFVELKLRFTY